MVSVGGTDRDQTAGLVVSSAPKCHDSGKDLSLAEPLVDFLRSAGADRLPHGHTRTLLEHLIGTRDIMRRWGQPEDLQRAALLHSVYGTDVYQRRLLPDTVRAELRRIAGERAEGLAHAFCTIPRADLLTAPDRDELLLLHMANAAEQSQSADGSPGRWLAGVQRLGRMISASTTNIPGPFSRSAPDITEPAEQAAGEMYRLGISYLEQPESAQIFFENAARLIPAAPEPAVWLSYMARQYDLAKSREWAAEADSRLVSLGTTWDKRLTYEHCGAIAAEIMSAAWPTASEPAESYHEAVRILTGTRPQQAAAGGSATPTAPAGTTLPGIDRFHRYIDSFASPSKDSARARYPNLRSAPWHDAENFPLAIDLQQQYPTIRDEIMALEPGRFHRESEGIGRTGDWDVIFFYERGRRRDENCDACPTLTRVIERHPTMRTAAGLIYLSRLRAGTEIAAHCGPTNMRLRCHLGIQVPRGDCGIRVGTETRKWEEGQCLVLDDFFEHEAWNRTKRDRIVLIVDMWHPGLAPAEVRLLEGLQRYGYSYARQLNRYWQRNDAAAAAAGQ